MVPEDPRELLEKVGRRISELRDRAGKTQADVAAAIGTGLVNYQRIEHGNQNVTLEMLVRIGNVLGVRAAEFLTAPEGAKRRQGRPKKK